MKLIYCYYVANKLASLHKMFASGNDVDQAPKKIGKFASDALAKEACLEHYNKACKIAKAAGREEPSLMWM